MVPFFGCGRLRSKGPKSSVWTFAVDSLRDLEAAVVPFFELHPLMVKQKDFEAFCRHRTVDAEEGASVR